MYTRIEDMPVYESRDDRLDARHYNLWRRARMNLGNRLRLPLSGLIGMELILDDRAWVVVDARQNDLPVLAWVDFEDQGRSALHEPVRCRLNFYHFAASGVRARVLDMLEQMLEERLYSASLEKPWRMDT